jgi:putative hydrolases of HD superfamily
MMNDDEVDLHNRLEFLREAERLKDVLRSGRTASGRAESVADHSWRLTLFAIAFADLLPGVDLLRLLKICILHDLGEAIGGDIPAPQQAAAGEKSSRERVDFRTLIEPLPPTLRSHFLELWDEYHQATSLEAQTAKALDKLETILQHTQGRFEDGIDFAFNLDYARPQTDVLPLTAALRRLLDAETAARIPRPGDQ